MEQISGKNKGASDHLISESATSARKCHHINVLVTSGSLIPSLVKCLLFRLDDLILHDNGQFFSLAIFCLLAHCILFSYFVSLVLCSCHVLVFNM